MSGSVRVLEYIEHPMKPRSLVGSSQNEEIGPHKKIPWPQSAGEPYLRGDRRLSVKIFPNFTDRGWPLGQRDGFLSRFLDRMR
jgi:hypothetical protein